MTAVAVVACVAASGVAAVRWLRVAQREHYLPGSVSRFALRWWAGVGPNRLLALGVACQLVLVLINRASPAPFALLVAAGVALGPFGLGLRGRAPGPLAWTRRLRTLAAAAAGIHLVLVAAGAALGEAVPVAAVVCVLTPLVVDAACALTAPLERRLARRFVDMASRRLREVAPLVVAITGSYGKTTTKGYTAHLISATKSVLATPRSFNNSAGLARTVNEQLAPGTEVFVAEMGTYGPGEIAEMCEWVRPHVAAITAIGPVHLERMGTEDNILAAKSEIFTTATSAVLNVDDQRLAALADRLESEGKKVARCSQFKPEADVHVDYERDSIVVRVLGREIARLDDLDALPVNIAVAVALALAVGVPADAIARQLPTLPGATNRLSVVRGASGATVLDDTYNANPAGAQAALASLRRHGAKATRTVVVTPGMIELGPRQREENKRFAAAASEIATDIVVVGATNRAALLEGAHLGRARVMAVDDRNQAVRWVKENVGPGDVVLYENDLPDHFP